jgi:hypothetical protein
MIVVAQDPAPFECGICLETDRDSKANFESCSHEVCLVCYRRMMDHNMLTCPFCRQPISSTLIRPVDRAMNP